MGLLDLFRRKQAATASAAPGADADPAARQHLDAAVEARFRAFDKRLAGAQLRLAGSPPFEWVEGSYITGGVAGTVRMVWTGRDVVEVNGVEGFAALLPRGQAAGLPLEELVAKVAELVHLKIHRSRDVVAGLCSAEAGYDQPASAAFLERFQPPRMEANAYVLFAEASPRPFVVFASNRSDIVRVAVDRDTLAVTSEPIGQGPQHRSPFGPGGSLPPGIAQPGRALVADDGAVVTAPAPMSASAEAAYWREQALGEHASIASFSRAVVELMAVGAPLELLERLHQAALDEIRHTRQCLELARRLDGREVTLGVVPALPPRPGSLAEIARRTLDEAAIPETIAARTLAETAAGTPDEPTRRVLLEQADDEARHAALAWDIVGWCHGRRASAATPPAAPTPDAD